MNPFQYQQLRDLNPDLELPEWQELDETQRKFVFSAGSYETLICFFGREQVDQWYKNGPPLGHKGDPTWEVEREVGVLARFWNWLFS